VSIGLAGLVTHAIRFYERRGALSAAARQENRYSDYTEADAEGLRLTG